MRVTPHLTRAAAVPAIDRRTTRHRGYAVSLIGTAAVASKPLVHPDGRNRCCRSLELQSLGNPFHPKGIGDYVPARGAGAEEVAIVARQQQLGLGKQRRGTAAASAAERQK